MCCCLAIQPSVVGLGEGLINIILACVLGCVLHKAKHTEAMLIDACQASLPRKLCICTAHVTQKHRKFTCLQHGVMLQDSLGSSFLTLVFFSFLLNKC